MFFCFYYISCSNFTADVKTLLFLIRPPVLIKGETFLKGMPIAHYYYVEAILNQFDPQI